MAQPLSCDRELCAVSSMSLFRKAEKRAPPSSSAVGVGGRRISRREDEDVWAEAR